MSSPTSTARPASTLLLVRDGATGLEVFVVERHHQIDFAGGATVFPGGKVEELDTDPVLRARSTGAEGLDPLALGFRVAALREAFEECGVLLARPRGSRELVSFLRLADLLKRYRGEVQRHSVSLARIAADEDLDLALDLLVPFAHWITPEGMPKRFDTHFFLVAAPRDQFAAHDGSESVDSTWIAPRRALDEADAGKRTVIFPTRMNLERLARSRTVEEAIDAARRQPIVTVLPRVERGPAGPVLRIPADAGYEVVEAPLEGVIPRSGPA
jgi:8-oxo-dGTP pyrophosphatase MutT (NUDIX family)